MRLEKRGRRPGGARMNLTPMVDIVFLLIVFFMLVNDMSRVEVEQLVLPRAQSGTEGPEGRRLILNVLANGDVYAARRRCVSGADRSPGRYGHLAVLLGDWADATPASALRVKIRADAEAAYKHVQGVLLECSKARIWKISFGCAPAEAANF